SSCAFWIATRTRSRASFTAASGRPTMLVPGSPPDRCTSTVTAGALTPSCARLWTMARLMRNLRTKPARAACATSPGGGGNLRSAEFAFQLVHARFQRFDLFARAQQHAALHVEFLARDQIEPAQSGPQCIAEICGEIIARLACAGRNQIGQAPGQIVDRGGIEHDGHPVRNVQAV